MEDKNPISPHIQIYNWHISSLVSISHRITGIINFFAITIIGIWIASLLLGEGYYEHTSSFLSSFFNLTGPGATPNKPSTTAQALRVAGKDRGSRDGPHLMRSISCPETPQFCRCDRRLRIAAECCCCCMPAQP